jgi:hypothetical protein
MSVSPQKPQISVSDSKKPSLFELDLSYSASLLQGNSYKSRKDATTESSTPTSIVQDLICCICGGESFLTPCEKPGCSSKVHIFCLSYFFPELLKSKVTCPSHSFNRLEDCSKLVHLSNQFNSLEDLHERVKKKSKNLEMTGNFFWFGISQQYFPFFQKTKPKLLKQTLNLTEKTEENNWISSKINETLQNLSIINQKTEEIFQELGENSRNYSKNPKIGENLENSSRMSLGLQGKFVRKYEKLQLKSLSAVRKDYEAVSICAVCDQFGEESLTTCSNCLISVHEKCYKLNQFDSFWICDHCKVHPMSAKICFLCPVLGGALKLALPNQWVHVTCAKYLQESFKSEFDVRLVNQAKFKLKCFSCGIKTGACVQCSYGRCANAFHVECRKDLLDSSSAWLCPHHKASKLTRMVRDSFESRQGFIKDIAIEVWNSLIGFKLPGKRKYVKSKKRAKDSPKTKFCIDFKQDSAVLKVFVAGKLLKVVKYLEEKGFDESGIVKDLDKEIKGQPPLRTDKGIKGPKMTKVCKMKNKLADEKLASLPLEVKNLGKPKSTYCYKGKTESLGVKLLLPKSHLHSNPTKKPKTCDFP